MNGHDELRNGGATSSASELEVPRQPSSTRSLLARQAADLLSRKARAALPLSEVGAGMLRRYVTVSPKDVVFVKGIFEASEGLAGLFSERGGELLIAAPHDRATELAEILADLEAETGAVVHTPTEAAGGRAS